MTSPDRSTLRQTAQGPVIGHLNERNTHAWRGIPYAQPPVGELRWRAPRPPQPWQKTLEALDFGEVSIQFASAALRSPMETWGELVGAEDCLTLNVYAPAFEPNELPGAGERLPVMFWIHGGGNSAGASTTYTTLRNLAAEDRVIVVSVNYRLGALGWLHLPEIAGAQGSAEDCSGNYGTLDLIAALRWVQYNIAAFGGNPDCVTIFGESAGAQNVLSLLLAPAARGLFHRAIAQSPVAEAFTPDEARAFAVDGGHPASALEIAARLRIADGLAADHAAARAQIETMSGDELGTYLRSKSVAELMAGFERNGFSIYACPRVIRDGAVLPACTMREAFADAATWNAVPVIFGANRDEMRLFMASDPHYVRMLGKKVPVIRHRKTYLRDAAYMSQAWEMAGVHEIAAAVIGSGHADVWVYRFDWDEEAKVPFIRPDLLLGAAHAAELMFVFRDHAGEGDFLRLATKHNRAGRELVGQAMGDYWTHFARTGSPADGARLHRDTSAGEPVQWPAWPRRGESIDGGPPSSACMVFDTPAGGGVRVQPNRVLPDALKTALREDARFESGEARCRLYARMYVRSIFREYGSESELRAWAAAAGVTVPDDLWRPTGVL